MAGEEGKPSPGLAVRPSRWYRDLQRNKNGVVPSHLVDVAEVDSDSKDTAFYCLRIKCATNFRTPRLASELVRSNPNLDIQLSATVSFINHRRRAFFGRSCSSGLRSEDVTGDEGRRVSFDDYFFYKSPLDNGVVEGVVELVLHVVEKTPLGTVVKASMAVGWTRVQLLGNRAADAADGKRRGTQSLRAPMYQGSPQALLFVEPLGGVAFGEEEEDEDQILDAVAHFTKRLNPIINSYVEYDMGPLPSLKAIRTLFRPHEILRGGEVLAGLSEPVPLTPGGFSSLELHEVCVRISQPSVTVTSLFDSLLLKRFAALRSARWYPYREKGAIVDRCLKVGLHNGRRYARRPVTVDLNAPHEAGKLKDWVALQNTGTNEVRARCAITRGLALVVSLEYQVQWRALPPTAAEQKTKRDKQRASVIAAAPKFVRERYIVGWTALIVGPDGKLSPPAARSGIHTLALHGSPHVAPDGRLGYTLVNPKTNRPMQIWLDFTVQTREDTVRELPSAQTQISAARPADDPPAPVVGEPAAPPSVQPLVDPPVVQERPRPKPQEDLEPDAARSDFEMPKPSPTRRPDPTLQVKRRGPILLSNESPTSQSSRIDVQVRGIDLLGSLAGATGVERVVLDVRFFGRPPQRVGPLQVKSSGKSSGAGATLGSTSFRAEPREWFALVGYLYGGFMLVTAYDAETLLPLGIATVPLRALLLQGDASRSSDVEASVTLDADTRGVHVDNRGSAGALARDAVPMATIRLRMKHTLVGAEGAPPQSDPASEAPSFLPTHATKLLPGLARRARVGVDAGCDRVRLNRKPGPKRVRAARLDSGRSGDPGRVRSVKRKKQGTRPGARPPLRKQDIAVLTANEVRLREQKLADARRLRVDKTRRAQLFRDILSKETTQRRRLVVGMGELAYFEAEFCNPFPSETLFQVQLPASAAGGGKSTGDSAGAAASPLSAKGQGGAAFTVFDKENEGAPVEGKAAAAEEEAGSAGPPAATLVGSDATPGGLILISSASRRSRLRAEFGYDDDKSPRDPRGLYGGAAFPDRQGTVVLGPGGRTVLCFAFRSYAPPQPELLKTCVKAQGRTVATFLVDVVPRDVPVDAYVELHHLSGQALVDRPLRLPGMLSTLGKAQQRPPQDAATDTAMLGWHATREPVSAACSLRGVRVELRRPEWGAPGGTASHLLLTLRVGKAPAKPVQAFVFVYGDEDRSVLLRVIELKIVAHMFKSISAPPGLWRSDALVLADDGLGAAAAGTDASALAVRFAPDPERYTAEQIRPEAEPPSTVSYRLRTLAPGRLVVLAHVVKRPGEADAKQNDQQQQPRVVGSWMFVVSSRFPKPGSVFKVGVADGKSGAKSFKYTNVCAGASTTLSFVSSFPRKLQVVTEELLFSGVGDTQKVRIRLKTEEFEKAAKAFVYLYVLNPKKELVDCIRFEVVRK